MAHLRILKRSGNIAVLAAAALFIVACSSGTSTPPAPSSGPEGATPSPVDEMEELSTLSLSDGLIRPDSGGEPVQGGVFNWYAHGEPQTLDPAVAIAAATTGGVEMLNIYDSMTSWNAQTQKFEPRTAKSVTPNQTFDEWTVVLNEGIEFSNGEPYNAEAIKLSQERYASMPAPEATLWNGSVTSIEVVDDMTLTYELNKTWMNFPSILSTGPGMIVAPGSETGEAYEPIGAGPFLFESWERNVELNLVANPNYWAGAPHLDGIRSVYMNDAQMGIDSLNSGSLDGSFALQSNLALQLVNAGYNGNASGVGASNVALINAAEGFPGHDVRVRQAILLAIDPQLIMDRVYESSIAGDASLFPEHSKWATPTRGSAHNPEEAKRLLDEAKADGYDGRIEFVDGADPMSRSRAMVVEAQLEAVGFDVDVEYTRTIADKFQRIAVDRDYQLTGWSINFRDADPTPKLFSAMHSSSVQTYSTYTSGDMDALIERFQVADSESEQLQIMDEIQQQLNEDVPFIVWSPYIEVLAWADNIHGIVGSANSMVFFDKAWKE